MSVTANINSVNNIYGAFGRGDIGSIIEAMHPDVEWEKDAVPSKLDIPWLRPGRGRAHVVRFFETLGANLRFEAFDVYSIMGEGDRVVALVKLEAMHLASGRRLVETCEVHVWGFDAEGRVVSMRHASDTLQHAEVAGLL